MYDHPDEIERDLRNRLNALTEGGRLLVNKMSPDQKTALRKLQDFERAVAAKSFKMQEDVLAPVEERIQKELFSRKVNDRIARWTTFCESAEVTFHGHEPNRHSLGGTGCGRRDRAWRLVRRLPDPIAGGDGCPHCAA